MCIHLELLSVEGSKRLGRCTSYDGTESRQLDVCSILVSFRAHMLLYGGSALGVEFTASFKTSEHHAKESCTAARRLLMKPPA